MKASSMSPKNMGGLYAPLAYDVAYVAGWLWIESSTYTLLNPGIWALVTLLGYYLLCLTLDYSINFGIGEGRDGLLKQLGVHQNGCLELLTLFPFFMVFLVAMTFPAFGVHEILIQWVDPKGIDGLDSNGLLKFVLVGFMFASVFVTYSVGNFFKGKTRWDGDEAFYTWVLPPLCLVFGAAVSHWGDAIVEREGMTEGMTISLGIYLYLPMRYLITRTMGISWLSLILSGLALLTVYWVI